MVFAAVLRQWKCVGYHALSIYYIWQWLLSLHNKAGPRIGSSLIKLVSVAKTPRSANWPKGHWPLHCYVVYKFLRNSNEDLSKIYYNCDFLPPSLPLSLSLSLSQCSNLKVVFYCLKESDLLEPKASSWGL